jgi:hypothetical protein
MPRSRKNPRKKKRAPPVYGDAPTPAQLCAQAEFDRQHQARRRNICNGFKFWRVCGQSRCERQHACAGDAVACFTRQWWRVDEANKIHFRAGIKARLAGLSVAEACRVADEEVTRSADHIARVNAETIARIKAEEAARYGE